MNRKELIQDITEILPEILPFPKKANLRQKIGLGLWDLAAVTGFALNPTFFSQGELGYSFIASWLGFHLLAGSLLGRAAIQYGIFKGGK